MTPQEALAQALHDYFREPSTKALDVDGTLMESAAAIIAALPEGWEFVDLPNMGTYILSERDFGAKRERERLTRVLGGTTFSVDAAKRWWRYDRETLMWQPFDPEKEGEIHADRG